MDFADIHQRQCTGADVPDTPSSDFEKWYPEKSGCLLGLKYEYIRRKRDATCYIGKNSQSFTVISSCACTREDYECSPCFEEDDERNCVASNTDDPSCPILPDTSVCNTNPNSFYYKSRGYQLIDFDQCASDSSDKWAPEKVVFIFYLIFQLYYFPKIRVVNPQHLPQHLLPLLLPPSILKQHHLPQHLLPLLLP